MDNPTPEALDKLLQDLSDSSSEWTRRNAARELGGLPVSNVAIVQALAAAVATDSDPQVRSAAVLALQAPVHQEFIKSNPTLLQQATESAIRSKVQKQQADDSQVMEQFARRVRAEKRAYLVFFLTIIAMFAGFVFMISNVDRTAMNGLLRLFQVLMFAVAGLFLWRSWRNWRCPVCNGWLSSWKARIAPFWIKSPVRCPHCGARLM